MLCDNLEGWDRVRGEKEVQGSGNENVSFYKQKRVSLGSGKHLPIVWRMSKSKNQSPAEAHDR